MESSSDLFAAQANYLFKSDDRDLVRSFERMTKLTVNLDDLHTFPLEPVKVNSKEPEKSLWGKFWDDGWSHVTFGTVSTAIGIGLLILVSGPVGWVSAALAIGGGLTSIYAGSGQLLSSNEQDKEFYAQMGNIALSANNIPGLATGVATYVFTDDIDKSVEYATIGGLAGGGGSFLKSSFSAMKIQKAFNLEMGLKGARYGSRVRKANAAVIGIDPVGLEASHLIPQRLIKSWVEKAPKLKDPIEKFFNGPLCIHFMKPTAHALVDPHRFRFLSSASKGILDASNPFTTMLIKDYPKTAQVFGFPRNLSSTIQPAVTSLVITSGRAVKNQAINSKSD